MSESQHRRGDAQDRTGVRQTRPSGTRQARPSGANGTRRPSSSGNPKKRRKRRKKRSVNSRIGKVLLIVAIVIAFAVAGAILGTVFGILQSTDMLNTSDVLPDSFWNTNFWLYWQTMFAFQRWSSALEMKRYLCRYVHHIDGLPDFSALRFTKYNQYESMILPLVKYLESHGVHIEYGMDVRNVIIETEGGKKVARQIVYVKDGREQTIDLIEDDLVFITNGCCTDTSCYGDQTHAPDLSGVKNGAGESWDMWKAIAAQAEQSCKNVGAVLAAGGTGLGSVIKTTCFLADMGDFAAFNEVYAKYFTSKPARSCVAVKSLPKGVLCEIEAIAEKLGLTVEWQDMEFGALVAAIGTKIDCSIAAMTITDERKQTVDFADPYFDAVQYIVMKSDAEIKTADDLKGLTIGVQMGTTGDYAAQEIEGATVQAYDKAVYAVNDLLNGKVDCVIVDQGPAKVFEANNEGKIVAVSGAEFGFEVEQYGIALPKGSPLVDQFNTALKELKEDGTYDALYEEYIVGYEE